MKKNTLLLSIALLLGLCNCTNKTNTTNTHKMEELVNYVEPYIQVQEENQKAKIIHKNTSSPQLILSSLLRSDLLINADFLKSEEIEDYFAIAKETNMNCLDLTIMWSQIEKQKDEYDFTDIDNYLNFAKKYDLKLNLIWYGSFVDGETHSANIPNYIYNDHNTYPIIMDLFDYANYGRCLIMDYANKNLLERESLALYEMMNHIQSWNEKETYDPVIMVQIGQGVDRFQRWRVNAYKIKDQDGNLYSSEKAWSMAKTYVNEVAKGVKYSAYRAITRVEFCEQNAVVNYVRDMKDCPYIDMVCPTYLHEISSTKNGIRSFSDEFNDMAIINAENWASDINDKQILATIALGGLGYVSYQLSSPNYYPESPNGALYGRYDASKETLKEKFVERNGRASKTSIIQKALLDCYVPVSQAPRSCFAVFGLDNLLNNKENEERIQKIYMSNGILLDYSNPVDSLGFAIYDTNYLYLYSSKDATLTISNTTIPAASCGYFNQDGDFESKENVILEANKTLNMKENEIYRVRISFIDSLPSA
ncbi:MAG: hypothetical protein MR270_05695, partial [Erysipelotrichaceae bacterium]|nr:hypothetical protein [Erysipelotrichaceae bacterium]